MPPPSAPILAPPTDITPPPPGSPSSHQPSRSARFSASPPHSPTGQARSPRRDGRGLLGRGVLSAPSHPPAAPTQWATSDQPRRHSGQRGLDRRGQRPGGGGRQLHRYARRRPLARVEEVDVERVLGPRVLRVVEVDGRLGEARTSPPRPCRCPRRPASRSDTCTSRPPLSRPGNGRRSPRSSASRRRPPPAGRRAGSRRRRRARHPHSCGTRAPCPASVRALSSSATWSGDG